MTFSVKLAPKMVEQLDALDDQSKRIIWQKIQSISESPFQFKKIHSRLYRKVFRVRLTIQGKENRLIYVVLEPHVVIACLLARNKDYRDLEKYVAKI